MQKPEIHVGDKVKLDAVIVAVDGENVTVRLDIISTKTDLLKFDDLQSTTNILD